MQIDPKITFWIGVYTSILLGIATGAVHLPSTIAAGVASEITSWCAFCGWVNTVILTALSGYSSSNSGPLVNKPIPPVAGKAALFLAAGLLGAALSFGAPRVNAAPLPPPHVKTHVKARRMHAGHPAKAFVTPDQIVAKILAWASADGDADLTAAIAMAKANNDTITLPCWTALQGFVKSVEALPPPASLPKLHLAVDVEVMTSLMIALQPNAPITTSCAALANAQKMQAVNMVSGIVTGALALGKLVPILP